MPRQLFAAGLQTRYIYPDLKNHFYKESSNVTWDEFLTTDFGLWIDKRSRTDNTLHGSDKAVGKSSTLLQIEKAPETSDGDLTCHIFSFEDAVANFAVIEPNRILTITFIALRIHKMFCITCWSISCRLHNLLLILLHTFHLQVSWYP